MFKLLLQCLFLLLILLNLVYCRGSGRQYVTLYPKLGSALNLPCRYHVGFVYHCYSTYTFQNRFHSMVQIQDSLKYKADFNSLTIYNIESTDAGYYACAFNCEQMQADNIDYYVYPINSNNIPVNTQLNWIAIPSLDERSNDPNRELNEEFYPTYEIKPAVKPECKPYSTVRAKLDTKGEIIIIIVLTVLVHVFVIAFLIVFYLIDKSSIVIKKEPLNIDDHQPGASSNYSTLGRVIDEMGSKMVVNTETNFEYLKRLNENNDSNQNSTNAMKREDSCSTYSDFSTSDSFKNSTSSSLRSSQDAYTVPQPQQTQQQQRQYQTNQSYVHTPLREENINQNDYELVDAQGEDRDEAETDLLQRNTYELPYRNSLTGQRHASRKLPKSYLELRKMQENTQLPSIYKTLQQKFEKLPDGPQYD